MQLTYPHTYHTYISETFVCQTNGVIGDKLFLWGYEARKSSVERYWHCSDETVHSRSNEMVNFWCFRCATIRRLKLFLQTLFLQLLSVPRLRFMLNAWLWARYKFSSSSSYYDYSIWHGTDYKIGLCLLVCQCVSVSACGHSHGRISWSIFTKIGTVVRYEPQKWKQVRWDQYRTTPSPILLPPPKKTPILCQEVLQIHTNIK